VLVPPGGKATPDKERDALTWLFAKE